MDRKSIRTIMAPGSPLPRSGLQRRRTDISFAKLSQLRRKADSLQEEIRMNPSACHSMISISPETPRVHISRKEHAGMVRGQTKTLDDVREYNSGELSSPEPSACIFTRAYIRDTPSPIQNELIFIKNSEGSIQANYMQAERMNLPVPPYKSEKDRLYDTPLFRERAELEKKMGKKPKPPPGFLLPSQMAAMKEAAKGKLPPVGKVNHQSIKSTKPGIDQSYFTNQKTAGTKATGALPSRSRMYNPCAEDLPSRKVCSGTLPKITTVVRETKASMLRKMAKKEKEAAEENAIKETKPLRKETPKLILPKIQAPRPQTKGPLEVRTTKASRLRTLKQAEKEELEIKRKIAAEEKLARQAPKAPPKPPVRSPRPFRADNFKAPVVRTTKASRLRCLAVEEAKEKPRRRRVLPESRPSTGGSYHSDSSSCYGSPSSLSIVSLEGRELRNSWTVPDCVPRLKLPWSSSVTPLEYRYHEQEEQKRRRRRKKYKERKQQMEADLMEAEAEQREAERRVAEPSESELREAEPREAEPREAERRETERREAKRREADKEKEEANKIESKMQKELQPNEKIYASDLIGGNTSDMELKKTMERNDIVIRKDQHTELYKIRRGEIEDDFQLEFTQKEHVLQEIMENYEQTQDFHYSLKSKLEEERKIAHSWKIEAKQYRLSYLMMKADLAQAEEQEAPEQPPEQPPEPEVYVDQL